MSIKKIAVAIVAIIAVITITTTVLPAFIRSSGNYSSHIATNIKTRETKTSWTISAKTVKGHFNRTINLKVDEPIVFNIIGNSKDGGIYFIMSQDDTEVVTDISGVFIGTVDTSGFEPGTVQLQLVFKNAFDVSVIITWD